MRSSSVVGAAIIAAAVLTGAAILSHAGPLNPPSGAVTSTYKSLSDVEPRTAINAANTPGDADSLFKISQPGSYYLTGNLTGVAGKNGIEIASEHVTIDLNGFTMNAGASTLLAIIQTGGLDSRITNGTVVGWRKGFYLSSISYVEDVSFQMSDLSDSSAIYCYEFGTFRNVSVYNCHDIAVVCQSSGVFTDCWALACGTGFYGAGSTFENCFAASCSDTGFAGNANTYRGCATNGCGTGFGATSSVVLEGCLSSGDGTGFRFPDGAAQLSNCTASNTNGTGFVIAVGSKARGCTADNCAGKGFDIGVSVTLENCTAYSCGQAGISGVGVATLIGCRSDSNSGRGFSLGNNCDYRDCSAKGNSGDGFNIAADSTLTACKAVGNTGVGFSGIDRCTLTGCVANTNTSIGFLLNDSCTLSLCRADNNLGDGFNARFGNKFDQIAARSNSFDGVETGAGGFISNSHFDSNGNGAGDGSNILVTGYGCRVEGNALVGADHGIRVTNTGNLIIRNSSAACPDSYGSITGGNTVGPLVNSGNIATNNSPHANYSH